VFVAPSGVLARQLCVTVFLLLRWTALILALPLDYLSVEYSTNRIQTDVVHSDIHVKAENLFLPAP